VKIWLFPSLAKISTDDPSIDTIEGYCEIRISLNMSHELKVTERQLGRISGDNFLSAKVKPAILTEA
jgi:hypothetical protein